MEKKKKIHYWYLIVPVLIFICGCLTGLLPNNIDVLAVLMIILLIFASIIFFATIFCMRWSDKYPKKQLIIDGLCVIMSLVVLLNIDNMNKYRDFIKDYNMTKNYLKETFGSSYHIKGYSYYKDAKNIDEAKCHLVFEVYLDDTPNETFEAGYCSYSNVPFSKYKVVTSYNEKNNKK